MESAWPVRVECCIKKSIRNEKAGAQVVTLNSMGTTNETKLP